MNVSNLEYHPYRSHAWFIPFSTVSGVCAYIASVAALPNCLAAIFLFGIGLLCTVLTRFLYISAQTAIVFESGTLRIAEKGSNLRKYILGNELPFGYYIRNYKGHLFLVLSSEPVDKKRLKGILNQSACQSKVCVDNAIVIYMDDLQDIAQIKEIVSVTVPFIENR